MNRTHQNLFHFTLCVCVSKTAGCHQMVRNTVQWSPDLLPQLVREVCLYDLPTQCSHFWTDPCQHDGWKLTSHFSFTLHFFCSEWSGTSFHMLSLPQSIKNNFSYYKNQSHSLPTIWVMLKIHRGERGKPVTTLISVNISISYSSSMSKYFS